MDRNCVDFSSVCRSLGCSFRLSRIFSYMGGSCSFFRFNSKECLMGISSLIGSSRLWSTFRTFMANVCWFGPLILFYIRTTQIILKSFLSINSFSLILKCFVFFFFLQFQVFCKTVYLGTFGPWQSLIDPDLPNPICTAFITGTSVRFTTLYPFSILQVKDCPPNLDGQSFQLWIGMESPMVAIDYAYSDSWFGEDQRARQCQDVILRNGYEYNRFFELSSTPFGGFGKDAYLLRCIGIRSPMKTPEKWASAYPTSCLDQAGAVMYYLDYNGGYLLPSSMMGLIPVYVPGTISGNTISGVIYGTKKLLWYPLQAILREDRTMLGSLTPYNWDYGERITSNAGNYTWEKSWVSFPRNVELTNSTSNSTLVSCLFNNLVYAYWSSKFTSFYIVRPYQGLLTTQDVYMEQEGYSAPWYVEMASEIIQWLIQNIYHLVKPGLEAAISFVISTMNFAWIYWFVLTLVFNKIIHHFPISAIASLLIILYLMM
ncbi:VP1 [Inopus flavus jingmenvirus 1]|nr:VP1 [Inopus flavus jingmenvirus 1]